MKQLPGTILIVFLAATGCGKKVDRPALSAASSVPTATEKEMGNTKHLEDCALYGSDGRILAKGKKCAGLGNECGRSSTYCSARLGFNEDPGEVIFEQMTRQEFIDTWNTDEGREKLMNAGVYER